MQTSARAGGWRSLPRPDQGLPYLAAVIAMLMVAALYLYFQDQSGQAQMHQRGIALAKLISGFEGSAARETDRGNLERLFEHQLIDASFAYGVIEDATARPVSRLITRSFVGRLPSLDNTADSSWLQSRVIRIGAEDVVEYYGRMGDAGTSALYYRFGFYLPKLGLNSADLRVGATLGLPIFLLVPLFLFLHARSSLPLRQIGERLADIVDGKARLQPVEITASGEIAEFIQRFNGFVDRFQGRLSSADRLSRKLLTQEKFLAYQSQRYESILQTVPDGILIVDEDLKVVFINQHVEAMFDVHLEAVLSSPLPAWCNHPELLDFVLDLKIAGQSATNRVVHVPHPDGRHTLGLSAHKLCFRHGSVTSDGTLVLLRDVSDEVAARQSRMEFVGTLAHEVKTPLNTIGLYAQTLETNGQDVEFRIEAQNVISLEVDRLNRLVHNLLKITQIEMGIFELDAQRVHLIDLVKDCVSSLDHGEDAARVRFMANDKISPVHIDKELLRIAVSNLIGNALKYSDPDRPVLVEIEEDDDAIRLAVIDQGIGISPDDQARIFDKFYRSSDPEAKKKAGHGLGLSIASEIIKLHHGTLSVESEPGKGSRFVVEFWKRTGIAQRLI